MELISFTVRNYRSIIQAHKLPISRSTVLVGPNNEGKSNILKALVSAMRVLGIWKEGLLSDSVGSYRTLKRHHIYDWELDYPVALQTTKPKGETIFDVDFRLTDDEIDELETIEKIEKIPEPNN